MGSLIKSVVILAIIGALVNHFVLGEKSHRNQLVEYAVREINNMSGQMIDNETLLKGAYESSRGLVINYQLIDFQQISFDRKAMNERLLENLKRKNCGKREIQEVLELGVAVNYVYFNAIDKKFAEVVLDENTCRG
ncbi:hypothetical protein [Marinicella litoralis]|uniref:Uncharacterized protein n=1 Tax=Marinicella litoralis TaxID=644220 RepID=A0A4R6XVG9_9GAMM|nr:hypothetical protein [Marinicella litoralis]TDR22549.1 hypothetical protein C8D91_1040 [Marinicella litoralis]